MDLFKQGMKAPVRPAPGLPGKTVNRYSPVTNWNDDPFSADVFEPSPVFAQKKKPPPRPPPPKVLKQPNIPSKPIHFMRKPTVLTSLLNRKSKPEVNQVIVSNLNSDVDAQKLFPKCVNSNIQTGTLIDLSSPPSSPTFTTRSSSDGISVDSFGSDATTSTNHRNALSGSNASQAESGFEDDFDFFSSSRKQMSKEDTFDDFTSLDPFSPVNKPLIMKKPLLKDPFESSANLTNQYSSVPSLNGPTIIRAKPARPKPPDNAALLKSTFSNSYQVTMSVNTTTPIHKVNNYYGDIADLNSCSWECEENEPDRESTPPMPTIPPPPPPQLDDVDLPVEWPDDIQNFVEPDFIKKEEPYAIALFDYCTDHNEDLRFSAGTKIILLKRVNEEWLHGKLNSGLEGYFPANFVDIKVPLPNDSITVTGNAVALYDFDPVQDGDLRFITGDNIRVLSKINDEWYYGECNGLKGQFPLNYVQIC
ncbi:uncharacterized protein LOC126970519 isoform X1 [Leptidea sinapis]|uniref:uncharacterized protein LOC126970519 isoform X1 n=2 Tax=Leptidea sinapis TaxID=189913 RepID=UPI0021C3EC1D|nr:uncharacterized protein LOC126970519 isoform X1 [Leptidea sinapis]